MRCVLCRLSCDGVRQRRICTCQLALRGRLGRGVHWTVQRRSARRALCEPGLGLGRRRVALCMDEAYTSFTNSAASFTLDPSCVARLCRSVLVASAAHPE